MKKKSLFKNKVKVELTDKSDGNMKVLPTFSREELANTRKNRLKAIKPLSLGNGNTALIRVTYDNQEDFCQFKYIESPERYCLSNDLIVERSDGILTSSKDIGLFLPLADCLGLVLFDSITEALMVVHCGRHTLLQDGARKAVEFMTSQTGTNPRDIFAWFSPSAGKDNYPVRDRNGQSLQELAIGQLIDAGVSKKNMKLSDIDTTTSDDFYSMSQGDKVDRFAICAKLA